MNLTELKNTPVSDLITLGENMGLENLARMRKQDIIFSILKQHETKNYTAGGEGGATLINDPALIDRAEIIREKGTNRSQFFRGQVDKYTWRDIGSSYLMADLQAAYLWAQLEAAERINQRRLKLWQNYYDALKPQADAGRIELPVVPKDCRHNAHMFYIKLKDVQDRTAFINYLKEAEIMAVFHYIPLHGL